MKNGTLYAGRLKKFFTKMRQSLPKPEIPEPDDPVRRLAVAILGAGCSDAEAARTLQKLLTIFVDWNDIRVSRAFELGRALDDASPAMQKRCHQLITALNSVYRLENKSSLDRLKNLGRREARQFLEKLPGMDEHAVAAVFLWSLGGHAIPVSDPVLQTLRDHDLVDPTADRSEIQAFLERNIAAHDAKEFVLLIGAFASERRPSGSRGKSASRGRSVKSAVGET